MNRSPKTLKVVAAEDHPCESKAINADKWRDLLPALDRDVRAALKADIADNGVLIPLEFDQDGVLLDGHHRLDICNELGIQNFPRVVRYFASDEERVLHILGLNLNRRHLSRNARASVVANLRNEGLSLRSIAGALDLSVGTVHSDLKKSGAQKLNTSKVTGKDGKLYPSKAKPKPPVSVVAYTTAQTTRAQKALATIGGAPKSSQPLSLKQAERRARQTRAELNRQREIPILTRHQDIEVRHGDFRSALDDLADGTVDLMFADPPYDDQWFNEVGVASLGELATRLLKPSGTLALMYSNVENERAVVSMAAVADLHYRGYVTWHTPGSNAYSNSHRMQPTCRPIHLYRRDTIDRFLATDYINAGAKEKDLHEWQLPVKGVLRLVELLSQPGNLVVDPTLGSGTTAVACRQLGRRFVGCDYDKHAVITTRKRLGHSDMDKSGEVA